MAYCSKCKRDYPESMKFCHECGSPLEIKASEEENTAAEAASVSAEFKRAKTKLGAQKTVLFLSLITVVVAFAMIVGVLLIVGIAAEKPNYALYVRDGELVYVGVSRRESIVLSDDLTAGDIMELNGSFVTVSRDRQYIIYPGSMGANNGFSLYVKSLRNSDRTDVKISSSIIRYEPSEDGNSIVYLEDDGDLYRYDINDEDKYKISTDVKDFAVSENFKKVLYMTKDGKLCVDGDVLVESLDKLEYYSSDFSLIAYSVSKELYSMTDFKEAIKLTDNMNNIFPSNDDKGSLNYYNNDIGYFWYSVALENDPSIVSLYYFDKKENTLISDKCFNACIAADEPYIIIKEKDGENYAMKSAYKSEAYPFEVENAERINNFSCLTDDGRTFYYLENYENSMFFGDLWEAELSKNGEIKSKKKIDTEVFWELYKWNDSILYYKNWSNVGKGDLYINGKLVDYEATVARVDSDGDAVYYYTNKDSFSGTLKVYRDGRAEKISENVYDFDVSFGGETFYITNYDESRKEGDLYLYRNGKSILIESGVDSLVKVYNREDN